jgi:hypothetical protein
MDIYYANLRQELLEMRGRNSEAIGYRKISHFLNTRIIRDNLLLKEATKYIRIKQI